MIVYDVDVQLSYVDDCEIIDNRADSCIRYWRVVADIENAIDGIRVFTVKFVVVLLQYAPFVNRRYFSDVFRFFPARKPIVYNIITKLINLIIKYVYYMYRRGLAEIWVLLGGLYSTKFLLHNYIKLILT